MTPAASRARRGVKGWVLYWATLPGGPELVTIQDREVVAVLPPRTGEAKVTELLERLFNERALSPGELLEARRLGSGPYPAVCTAYVHDEHLPGLAYACGHSPVLVGRRAEAIRMLPDGTLEWTEVGPTHSRRQCEMIHGLPVCAEADKPAQQWTVRSAPGRPGW